MVTIYRCTLSRHTRPTMSSGFRSLDQVRTLTGLSSPDSIRNFLHSSQEEGGWKGAHSIPATVTSTPFQGVSMLPLTNSKKDDLEYFDAIRAKKMRVQKSKVMTNTPKHVHDGGILRSTQYLLVRGSLSRSLLGGGE